MEAIQVSIKTANKYMMYTYNDVLLSLKEEAGSDPFYSWNEPEG